MSPGEYESQYHDIQVPLPDGTWAGINLRKYLSGPKSIPPAKDALLGFVDGEIHKHKSLTLRIPINGAVFHRTYTNRHEVEIHIVKPFYGKGAPGRRKTRSERVVVAKEALSNCFVMSVAVSD